MIQYIYILKFNDKFRLVTAMHSNGPLPQANANAKNTAGEHHTSQPHPLSLHAQSSHPSPTNQAKT